MGLTIQVKREVAREEKVVAARRVPLMNGALLSYADPARLLSTATLSMRAGGADGPNAPSNGSGGVSAHLLQPFAKERSSGT